MKRYLYFTGIVLGWVQASGQDISNSSALVLPQSPSTNYVVAAGQSVQITSGQSVTLLPNTHLQAGSNVTIKIGNTPFYPIPPSNPSNDSQINWVQNTSYDEDGNIIGESKSFFDNSGKPLQSQIKSMSNGNVLASQSVYDTQDRPAISTLPAPVNNSAFAYKPEFVTNTSGTAYNHTNFDLTKTNNPDALGNNQEGTLGWYYSNNNTLDASVTATAYPYSRTDFYQDGTGVAKRMAGPSEQLKMGMGHEVSGNSFPVINELEHYKSIRSNFFTTNTIGQNELLPNKYLQSYQEDSDGLQSVSITDLSGNVLMSALGSTAASGLNVANTVLLGANKDEYFVDLINNYVDTGQGNAIIFSIQSPNIVTVYKSGGQVYQGKGDLFDQQTYGGITLTASYKVISNFPFAIIESDHSYDAKYYEPEKPTFHYFKLVTPSSVTVTGSHKLYNMLNETEVSSTGTLPKGYYKLVSILNGGEVTLSYSNSYSNISYNFYNQLGQVVATIAPEGVKKIIDNGLAAYSTLVDVPFVNTYEYDLQGRLIATNETDAGRTEYVYRKDGNIRFSQNAEQRKSTHFSYTNYDRWGRPIESGEYVPGNISFATAKSTIALQDNIEADGGLSTGSRLFWVKTHYDEANNSHGLIAYQQDEFNLRGGVSWTENANSKTWYNYDEDGRVKWVIKHIEGLGKKTIDYTYNAQGNVSKVDYQKDTPTERFIHEYEYDADDRLKVAYTATIPGQRKEQARYYYYLHGPLKRVELAENLQGLDYTYTAQGWLKAINHPLNTNDPGKDGTNNSFAPDAFGMTLEYFTGDYSRSGTGISSLASNTNKNYYNGNIVAQSWRSQKPAIVQSTYGAGVNNPAMFTYEYDDKYQFESNKYGTPNFGNNTFTEAVNVNREYGLTYDANGNIKTLNRTNTAGSVVNNFGYNYQTNTNKLASVPSYANYEYDDLGQLTRQQKGTYNVYLTYDVSGKVIAIYADAAHSQLQVSYAYDEAGMRIRKTDHVQNIITYYVPDASGNVLAIYDNNGTALTQKELPVYAVSRIGTYNKIYNNYQYELNDHLGNVRVVINQSKVNGLADVVYYSDYYPYGSPLSLANNDYRYGYQGQYAEADKETAWNAFELRNYDAAIGRWLSVDPYGQYASPYLGMGNNPVMGVDPDGGYSKFGAWIRNVFSSNPIYQSGFDNKGKEVWGFNDKNGVAQFGENRGMGESPISRLDNFFANPQFSYQHTYYNPSRPLASGAIEPNYFFEEMIIGGQVVKGGFSAVRYGLAAKGVTNAVPGRLARVIPANISSKTLGAPGAADVFVTAADDIAGLNASQIAQRLTIPNSSSGFRIIEFNTPRIGLSSPINRTNPGFIGFGRTAGGAREFALPNQLIPNGSTIRIIR